MAALLLGGTSGASRVERGGRAPGPPLFRHPFPFRRRDAMVPRHGRMWDSTLYPKGGTGHGECDHSRQRRAGKGPESRAGAQEDQGGGRIVSRERPLRSGGDGSSGEFRGDPRNRLRQDPAASRGAQQPYDVLPRSVTGYPGDRPAAGVRAARGVIVGPDGAPWVTDSGLNAIVRVDPATEKVRAFPLPEGSGYVNLNTAAFDGNGILWFTGQSGIYGRMDPRTGKVEVFDAPKGRGPYGIATAPDGRVYFASLAGSYVGRIDPATGTVAVLSPPTRDQGARRVWPDSKGRIWVSEWNAGRLGMYDPSSDGWHEWTVPGKNPMPYAVYVDGRDKVWITDFGDNAFVRFDPENESFEVFRLPSPGARVRQLLGRPGEVWGAESGTDKLVVVRDRPIRK